MEVAERWPDRALSPDAVLDGGGEEWSVLERAMQRSIDRISEGDVLEVVSEDRRSRGTIPAWCLLYGHELLEVFSDDHSTRFWVRKGRQER